MSTKENKRTILLVDDDPSLLVTVGQFLRFEGYDVVTAESGEAALDTLKTLHPHLIILDMSMPGMGGIGFLQRITGENGSPRFPVLVLTARAQMAEFFADIQVDGFLTKPADPDALLAEVARILFQHGFADEAAADFAGMSFSMHSVLLADANTDNLRALRRKLEGVGYTVDAATTGPEAVEKLLVRRPDALVANISLPALSGAALVGLVRQMPSVKGTRLLFYGLADAPVADLPTDDLTVLVDSSDAEEIRTVVDTLV